MKNFKELALPAIVLTIICLIVSAALVASNSLTAPLIEQTNIKQANESRNEVFPNATEFEKMQVDVTDSTVTEVYKASDSSGIVVTTLTTGYGGDFEMMTGIDKDGIITGTKVTSSSETPGLGSKATVPDFLDQFKSKSTSEEIDGVDNVAGATISSTAVKTSLQAALEVYNAVKGELQ